MPTFAHGRATIFKVESAATVLTDISNTLKEVNFPREVDTPETTAFGSTTRSYVVGFINATFSVSGMYDPTVDALLNGILGFATARNFEYGPVGSTSTNPKYTGACYLTNYTDTGSVTDMVGMSADFQVTGAVTRGAYP